MKTLIEEYRQTAESLCDRMVALGPKILECERIYDLYDLGLNVDGLEPSLAQAHAAWAQAKAIVRKQIEATKQ